MPLADFINDISERAAKVTMTEELALKIMGNAQLIPCTRDTLLDVAAHMVAICAWEEALVAAKVQEVADADGA